MVFGQSWRQRALLAEQQQALLEVERDALYKTIEEMRQSVIGIDVLLNQTARLISIARTDGNNIRLIFTRNDQLHTVEFYGTWEHDVEAWQAALIHPIKPTEVQSDADS